MNIDKKDKNNRNSIDISVFDNPILGVTNRSNNNDEVNQVLMINLEKIIEDSNQPRTEFNKNELDELSEDIKIRGVQQPIIVKPKNNEGKYQIIHGARRFRASRLAGNKDIKVIIENDYLFDDYSQIAENIKREDLSDWDLANFIKKKVDEGEKQVDIAKKLAIHKQRVTEYLSIFCADNETFEAFKKSKFNGIRAFYEFIKFKEKYPEKAKELLESEEKINQSIINRIKKDQENKNVNNSNKDDNSKSLSENNKPNVNTENQNNNLNIDNNIVDNNTEDSNENSSDENIDKNEPDNSDSNLTKVPYHNPELDKNDTSGVMVRDPNKIKKPLLLGIINDGKEDREIKILWSKKPNPGFAHIQYEDTGLDDCVELSQIKLTLIGEMKVEEAY